MKFKAKLSTLTLSAALLLTSAIPVSAAARDSIVGADRYETAAKIADRMGSYNTAILVNSDKSLADGLSASSLAGKENAPILLVKQNSIPDATMARLENVSKVYIIGGTAAISENIEWQLYGKEIIRISGKDRLETSGKIAELMGMYDKAFVVNGFKGEADAMSVASVAARDHAPILLTDGIYFDHMQKFNVQYYLIGGNSVVDGYMQAVLEGERIAGSDRYETNRKVLEKFYPETDRLYYTKGNPLVDALTVSSLAKNDGVMLVSKNSDNSIVKGKSELVQVGGINFNVDLSGNSLPKLNLTKNIVSLDQGDKFDISMFGINATDVEDGNITAKVKVNKKIDTLKVGKHTLTLSVTDSNGATVSKNVTVTINKKIISNPSKPNVKPNINTEKFQQEFRKEFFKLLNDYRWSCGVPPVEPMDDLNYCAYFKSEHMGTLNYFEHWYDDTETKYYQDRWNEKNDNGAMMRVWDIKPEIVEKHNPKHLTENIYCTWKKRIESPKFLAEMAFNGWKSSPGHNANMLRFDSMYTGLGAYREGEYIYVTSNFMKK